MFYALFFALFAFVLFAGVVPTGRKNRKNAPRKSPAAIVADLISRARSAAIRALVHSANPTRPGYVPEIGKCAAGLIRAKRDTKRFTFYANPDNVSARAKHLRDRADAVEMLGAKVQSGEIARTEIIGDAESAFARFSEAYLSALQSGNEPDVSEIFRECFPDSLRANLGEYAETPDPFAGTDDETEDSDENDDSDDSTD